MLSGNSFLKEDKNEIESKNEFKILPKQLPTCNVLWVGQPCDRKTVYEITKRTGTIIDHDINSIVELSTKLENPISYWCLDKYVDLYKERFSKMGVKDKVTVHSIEGFLKECTQSENKTIKDGALFVLSLINLLISKGEKSKIIELITIKDCFSLFLLLANGGYTLDSNLFPTQNHSLPDFSHFCAPSSQYSTDC
ncbi:MAG: hypothetical protein JO131_06750, partial [Gammaproteobacteria bacterium]|nr:hypothetical protein [Gammaproteobacteria bacterium]